MPKNFFKLQLDLTTYNFKLYVYNKIKIKDKWQTEQKFGNIHDRQGVTDTKI